MTKQVINKPIFLAHLKSHAQDSVGSKGTSKFAYPCLMRFKKESKDFVPNTLGSCFSVNK